MKKLLITAAALGLITGYGATAHATNGMDLEGYGPIALGMGGASYAYDNGTAAMMNNPATIGLSEKHRFDLALGFLGPDVTAKPPAAYAAMGVPNADSSGDAYYMPAIGWTSRKDKLSYGIGVFGQGGMGTEYSAYSFLAAGSGQEVRSEVSVGRAMIPLAYNVNDKFIIGGTIDFVWAGMDLKMALGPDQFMDLVDPSSQMFGAVSGSMVDILGGAMQGGMITGINWARFDFSDSSDFTGEATGYGAAAKIGVTYKVTPKFTLGATYQSKTAMGDLETDNALVSMNLDLDMGEPMPAQTVQVAGQIKVKDFEWPDTYGIGMAYQVTDRFMVAADVKQIRWSDVMEDFKMTFTANQNQTGLAQAFGLGGTVMNATLYQHWDDQTVFEIGGSFKVTDMFTLRGGYNHASNPIPDMYLNPLFPAIVEDHITAGLGVDFNEASSLNAALSFALENSALAGSGVTSEHSQLSWQLMYTYRY